MVLTPSMMVPLGSAAPDFKLPDVTSGKDVALSELRSDTATMLSLVS